MLVYELLATPVGAALLAAAALKVGDRTGTAVAAATFGLRGPAARWVWLPLAALEAALAIGLIAGVDRAAAATTATLAAFAAAQAVAIAAGRAGAPCGCFGARGRISWGSVARTALLAAAAAPLVVLPASGPVAPALGAVALAAAIVVWARRPAGALEVPEEGPPLGSRLALGDDVRLALFVADGCRLCRALTPLARRLGAAIYDQEREAGAWSAAAVPGAPFAVAFAADGTVLAKGTVNTRAQLRSVVRAARARGVPGHPEPRVRRALADRGRLATTGKAVDGGSSRRRFLATAGSAVAALTAGRMVGSLVAPGEADAFHFCGHIYTTDGCPHPTGLPRIDSRGRPLRASDGRPVDDLGRLVDASGAPIDGNGAPLLDPDGRPQPPATRTPICVAAGRRYRITVRTDGAWYRCCNGQVRKLVDCCTTSSRRINGDRGLRGYCYGKRRVFCVMYFQTRVPC